MAERDLIGTGNDLLAVLRKKDDGKSPYELAREENIARNNAFLVQLGLKDLKRDMETENTKSGKKKRKPNRVWLPVQRNLRKKKMADDDTYTTSVEAVAAKTEEAKPVPVVMPTDDSTDDGSEYGEADYDKDVNDLMQFLPPPAQEGSLPLPIGGSQDCLPPPIGGAREPIHDMGGKMKVRKGTMPQVCRVGDGHEVWPATKGCKQCIWHLITESNAGRRAKAGYFWRDGCRGYPSVKITQGMVKRAEASIVQGLTLRDALVGAAEAVKLFVGCPHVDQPMVSDVRAFLQSIADHSVGHSTSVCGGCALSVVARSRGNPFKLHKVPAGTDPEVYKAVRVFVTLCNGWSARLRQGQNGDPQWVGRQFVVCPAAGKTMTKDECVRFNSCLWKF